MKDTGGVDPQATRGKKTKIKQQQQQKKFTRWRGRKESIPWSFLMPCYIVCTRHDFKKNIKASEKLQAVITMCVIQMMRS